MRNADDNLDSRPNHRILQNGELANRQSTTLIAMNLILETNHHRIVVRGKGCDGILLQIFKHKS
jgi:hypothetical protein